MLARTLLVALLIGGLAPTANAAPNQVAYELQERCGKQAAEYFEKKYRDGESRAANGDYSMSSYENHYQKTLNKCFIQISSTVSSKNPKSVYSIRSVLDINANKIYGYFLWDETKTLPTTCKVDGNVCHSLPEWDALVKPFMDDVN